jgi:YbbR domain-containing protein
VIDNLARLEAVISANGESQQFEQVAKILAYKGDNAEERNIEISPSEVKAKVSIVRSSNSKTVGIKVVTDNQLKPGYYLSGITTNPVTVDIMGPHPTIDDLKYIETAVIPLGNQSANFETDANINLPNGITLTSKSSPTKIRVNFTISAVETSKDIVVSQVLAQNLPSGYKIKGEASTPVRISCSGPASTINSLKGSDISIVIDFQGRSSSLTGGIVSFELSSKSFKVPDNVNVLTVSPQSINVELNAAN